MRGFPGLKCPECNEADGLTIDLQNCSVSCTCEANWKQDKLTNIITNINRQAELWMSLAKWIQQAPEVKE